MKTLYLVSCSGKKLTHKARAEALYISPLFKLTRAVVLKEMELVPEASWGILSAEHGFIFPDIELDPYDRTLSGMKNEELNDWGSFVANQLNAYKDHVILVYAGVRYLSFRQYLPLRTRGNTFNVLRGTTIGQRLSVLKNRLSELESK